MNTAPDADAVVHFDTADALEAWLEAHADSHPGVWLKVARKGTGARSVSYPDALEVALCFGWIDGQKRQLDDSYWLQRFSPRTSRSRWSSRNREIARKLIEDGRMRPAGQHEIDRAERDGRWAAAYDGQRTATVPPDLQAILETDPAAAAAFAALNAQNRYAIIYRLNDAKRAETRARRLASYIDMLHRGEQIHPS